MGKRNLSLRRILVSAVFACVSCVLAHAQDIYPDSTGHCPTNYQTIERFSQSKEFPNIENDTSTTYDYRLLLFPLSNPRGTMDNEGWYAYSCRQKDCLYSSYPCGRPDISFSLIWNPPGEIFVHDAFKITGNVGETNYPGMMAKQTGNLELQYSRGNFSVHVGAIVNKYGFFGGLISQPGIGISAAYRLNPVISLNAYGYWYGRNNLPILPNGLPMPPSMLGYYEVNRAGGYVTISPSGHFGVKVGGQVVQRQGAVNHYEVEPIATPYVTVGKGKKKIGIGLPVGQILNGIFKR